MAIRRNRGQLERAVAAATTPEEVALAHYRLAVFHDNNSREAEAIPHYQRALQGSLDRHTTAHALAYLASSLHKTGQPQAALDRVEEALTLSQDPELTRFLLGLRGRIQRRVREA